MTQPPSGTNGENISPVVKDLIYPLVVAIVAGLVTLLVTLLVRRLDRRARDTALLRRIEIYERLPEDVRGREKVRLLIQLDTDDYLRDYDRPDSLPPGAEAQGWILMIIAFAVLPAGVIGRSVHEHGWSALLADWEVLTTAAVSFGAGFALAVSRVSHLRRRNRWRRLEAAAKEGEL